MGGKEDLHICQVTTSIKFQKGVQFWKETKLLKIKNKRIQLVGKHPTRKEFDHIEILYGIRVLLDYAKVPHQLMKGKR